MTPACTFGPNAIRSRQAGMSLIELMVALTLGLIIIGAVASSYLASKQSYRVNENLARMQESARYAFDFLSKDLRMAGYFGCPVVGASITNTLNDADQFAWDFTNGIYGYEANNGNSWSPALPGSASPAYGPSSVLSGRDVITVRGVMGSGIYVLQQPGNNSADLKVTANSNLQQNDIVLVSHCRAAAAIFQITNTSTAQGFDNLVHNTGGTHVPGNATKDLGNNFVGAEVMRIATRSYFIRDNDQGVPSLYRRIGSGAAEELVEGVEDMQVQYGVDNAGNDFAVDRYLDAGTVTANGQWGNVISVRMELLLRSPEDSVVGKPQTYVFDGATVTAGDRRLHKGFSATVTLRNRTM